MSITTYHTLPLRLPLQPCTMTFHPSSPSILAFLRRRSSEEGAREGRGVTIGGDVVGSDSDGSNDGNNDSDDNNDDNNDNISPSDSDGSVSVSILPSGDVKISTNLGVATIVKKNDENLSIIDFETINVVAGAGPRHNDANKVVTVKVRTEVSRESVDETDREDVKIRLEKFFTSNSGDLTETAVDLLRSIHGSYSASTSSLNALWYRSGFAVPPSSSPASVSFESYLNAIRNVVNVEFQSSSSRSEKRDGE